MYLSQHLEPGLTRQFAEEQARDHRIEAAGLKALFEHCRIAAHPADAVRESSLLEAPFRFGEHRRGYIQRGYRRAPRRHLQD